MSYTFRPAVREQTSLLIGLAGPSGSGKTASALKLARGIMGGKDEGIFCIDTEADRALHYACGPGEQPGPFRFRFQHCSMGAPFSPAAYQEAIEAAVAAGAKVVVVDSMSHAHEGEGGVLEMHEKELDAMAGKDWGKRERMTFSAWIKPKAAANRLVNTVLQKKCHFVFCFRAKDKMKLVNQGGKLTPVQMGWTPICTDRFEYEMVSMLMLPPNARGVPDLSLESTKINAHHVDYFPAGKPVSEDAGAKLAAWARGGAVSTPAQARSVQAGAETERAQAASTPDDSTNRPTAESDERAALLGRIEAAQDKQQMSAAKRAVLWRRHCGETGPDTVDVSALADLYAAVSRSAVA